MPLVWIAVAWLAGLALASIQARPLWAWLLPAAAGLLAAVVLWRRAALRLPLICLLAFALGGARYQSAQPVFNETTLAFYNRVGTVTVEGVVRDEPLERATRTDLRLAVERLWLPNEAEPRAVSGLALIAAPRFSDERRQATGQAEWRYGDRLRVTGELETPPVFEDFSYRDYLARFAIYSQIRQARVVFLAERQGNPFFQLLFDFKAHALATLERLFPEPHAALLQGILLGNEARIPDDVKTAFSITGTSHIVAISGFNLAVLIGIFMALFSRVVGPVRGAALTIVVIIAYTVLVGAGASVVRAAIMGSLGVIAQRLGRRSAGLNTLALAAVGMTLFNPLTLWDVGFQLSAAATLGLILYAEPFENTLSRWLAQRLSAERAASLARLVAELFLLTFAAQLTTLPIIAYTFEQVSLISLIANMVILPVQPAVMILGGIALLLGLVWLPLGQLAAWSAYPFLAYTLAFVKFFAQVPGASLALGEVAPAAVAVFYVALFGVTWMLSQPAEKRPAWWATFARESLPLGGAAVLGVVAFLAWGTYFSLPEPGRLTVTVLDAGRGDGVLIQTPAGNVVLVNGGPSGNALVRGLNERLPLFHNRLELLVIAGVRDESVAGLPEALERYRVERVLLTQAGSRSAAYRLLLDVLNTNSTEKISAADLPEFNLGDGICLRVLADGERGSVMRLEWRRFSLLWHMAADAPSELQPVTALLVTPRTLNDLSEPQLSAIDPRVVLLSAEATGVISPATAERLAGRTLLRTDERGALTLTTDGERLWVETER
ncbi:MAG: ComEC/Rec2 family competence protein [Anaerolineales bacterium]|nr:ComEC/Rec2 family competence protein [Anaerolineales bacterium]